MVTRHVSLPARFGPAAMATAVVGLVVTMAPLTPLPLGIAIACIVASWVAPAMTFARHAVRTRASVVAGIAAVTAAGQTQAGVVYGIATGAFLLVSVASMRMARNGVPRTDAPAARPSARAVLTLGGAAACISATLIASLPWLAAVIERKVSAMLVAGVEEETAFSTNMVLGATRGMLQSSTIVMRIDGERPEYLRGAVYDHYTQHFWRTSAAGGSRKVTSGTEWPSSAGSTRITLVRGAPNGEDMRWFLPPNACDLATQAGLVDVDAFGVARRARSKENPQAITFRTSHCTSPALPIAPPSEDDLDVPRNVATALGPIAATWTKHATTDRARLDAIKRELARFEYSLAATRDPKLDPVIDFVTVHRAGHCEYFASAMALMARTQGIPARVVGGYRVSEVNPLTGRAIVRDRNAHTWVEAWVDNAWTEWDPTPPSETFARRAGALDNLGDVVSSVMDDASAVISRLGPFSTIAVLASIVGSFFAVRGLARVIKPRVLRARANAKTRMVPLPCFVSLTDALARAGHERDPSEPVEVFARRLATVETPWAADASQALLLYADLRYGGLGDEAAIVRQLDRAARAVRAHR